MSPADTPSDIAAWRDWIGREDRTHDIVAPMRLAELSATLDRDDPFPKIGDPVPPLAHWLFCAFLGLSRTSELGADGHPKRGGFLPPVDLPRRMWAASDVRLLAPLHVGESVMRVATIEDVVEKSGRTGKLVFVTVRHEYTGVGGLAVVDRQTVVYREAPVAPEARQAGETAAPPPGKPASAEADFTRKVTPNVTMLFRYSSLIFNAHRIHFDHPFATEEEGYPALVVHGPLLATLLADLVCRERKGAHISRFRFRAVQPMFEGREITLAGRDTEGGLKLWAANPEGEIGSEAEVTLAGRNGAARELT